MWLHIREGRFEEADNEKKLVMEIDEEPVVHAWASKESLSLKGSDNKSAKQNKKRRSISTCLLWNSERVIYYLIYYIINTWSKNFGPLFTKIART